MENRWQHYLILTIFGLLIGIQLITLVVGYKRTGIVIVEIAYPLPKQTNESLRVRPKPSEIEAMLIQLVKDQGIFVADYRPEIYDFNDVRYVTFAARLTSPQQASTELAEKLSLRINENLAALGSDALSKYDRVITSPSVATRSLPTIRGLDIVAFLILVGMFIYWLPYKLTNKKMVHSHSISH